ncbi:MAG: DUF6340 family protein [Candidatus Cryptobacteroides sp.]|nr:DUF6340 family protein [Candidatus Cryptobacteroides sp.]
MKRSLLSAIAALSALVALQSCDPQAFSMNVEMRYPSSSGMSIDGKSVAVVYLNEDSAKDSVFNECLANGFASAIEKNYFNGAEAVNLYKMPKVGGGVYSNADTLINLIVDTGCDIVFLFDAPEFGNVQIKEQKTSTSGTYYPVSVPVAIKLYGFDSLSGSDTVRVWTGTRMLSANMEASLGRQAAADSLWNRIGSSAENLGEVSARTFAPVWKEETYTFIYYESPEAWLAAAQYATDYKWNEAMKVWISLLDTNNPMKRSCAEYNIATACFLMGDNELALKWLNSSDEDYPISLSKTLRKRIQSRIR